MDNLAGSASSCVVGAAQAPEPAVPAPRGKGAREACLRGRRLGRHAPALGLRRGRGPRGRHGLGHVRGALPEGGHLGVVALADQAPLEQGSSHAQLHPRPDLDSCRAAWLRS